MTRAVLVDSLTHNPYIKSIKTEFVRKSIHFLIALVPVFAAWNYYFTVALLAFGILVYVLFESLRSRGIAIPVITSLTVMASRPRDEGRFVIGPVTLGLGALLVLVLFPPHIASIAIYALAFGDGFASLLGKPFGRIKPVFMHGKSLEGTLACFTAVFLASWNVSKSIHISLIVAISATIIEAMPLEDFDNILMPFATALILFLLKVSF